MKISHLKKLVESFEAHLGSPWKEGSLMNFNHSLYLDEREELPQEEISKIQKWGYMNYLIPSQLGGKLDSLLTLYFINRAISRRDLTTSIALGLTFLASLPIWIGGKKEQQIKLAAHIQAGHIGALALTEENHGTDLSANEMQAVFIEGKGWKLNGSKWCVNYATLGTTATILCRTHPSGGPLGFSLFFLDKMKIQSGITTSEKLPTHGVRGLDISGFSLSQVTLPPEALIGEKNKGLEITYKTLQISRALCTNLSIGSADTALRLTLLFSLQRQLYGQPAFNIPAVKHRLAECFTYILIAECTAIIGLRAGTLLPQRMSFWSSIGKFLIPKISEKIVNECALVMGARAFLRTTEWAIFQKIRRDNQIVGLFDGSSQVNLFIIASNLLPQVKLQKESQPLSPILGDLFNLEKDVPAFSGQGLHIFNQGVDEIINGFKHLESAAIHDSIQQVQFEITALQDQILRQAQHNKFDERGLNEFRLAENYSWLFAACCTIYFWIYNQDLLHPELKDSKWVTMAVQLILSNINRQIPSIPIALYSHQSECLKHFLDNKQMFSPLPISIQD